jgi:general secretion pathway protein C
MLESLAERWPVSLPLTTTACIVALTAGAIAWQVWLWQAALRPIPGTTPVERQDRTLDNPVQAILDANLFGEPSSQGKASTPISAVPATAGLTLRAAFAGHGGGAVIEGPDGDAHWYPVNAAIATGVRLLQVHADHVVLDREGRMEMLAFPPPGEFASVASGPTAHPLTAAPGSPPRSADREPAVPIPANASSAEKARMVRERLEELRNRSRT